MSNVEEHKIGDQNAQNNEEEEYASLEEFFIDSCRFGDLDDVIGAITDGVDINYFDNNLNTALHMACANGHLDVIKEILKVTKDGQRVANINARNSDGSTPLHWAVINTQKAVIELLLENNADCNIKSKYGQTPLDEAITGGIYEIAEMIAAKTKPDEEELQIVEEEVGAGEGGEEPEDDDEEEGEEKMSDS